MRISDLGLAEEVPEGETIKGRVGTVGYMGKYFSVKFTRWSQCFLYFNFSQCQWKCHCTIKLPDISGKQITSVWSWTLTVLVAAEPWLLRVFFPLSWSREFCMFTNGWNLAWGLKKPARSSGLAAIYIGKINPKYHFLKN